MHILQICCLLLCYCIALVIVIESERRVVLTNSSLINWRNSFPLGWLWPYWLLTVTKCIDFFFYRNLLGHFYFDGIHWNMYIRCLLKSKSWITYTNNFLWTIANDRRFILSMRWLLLDLLMLIIALFAWNFSWLLRNIKRCWVFKLKMLVTIMLIEISLTVVNIVFNIFLVHHWLLHLWIYIDASLLNEMGLLLEFRYLLVVVLSIHDNRFVFSMLYS